jgi:hypothetical protein
MYRSWRICDILEQLPRPTPRAAYLEHCGREGLTPDPRLPGRPTIAPEACDGHTASIGPHLGCLRDIDGRAADQADPVRASSPH